MEVTSGKNCYMDSFKKIAITTLLFISSYCVHGKNDPASFSPATFPEDLENIISRIDFPKFEGNFRFLAFCSAQLSKDGRFGIKRICWPGHPSIDYQIQASIDKAMSATRMIPAQVNGKNTSVWFQFAVEFVQQDDNQQINIYPNHLIDTEEFGFNYTAPQRYSLPIFISRYCYRKRGSYPYESASNLLIILKLTVDTDGLPQNVAPSSAQNLEFAEGSIDKRCLEHQIERNVNAKYIPAFKNGEAISLNYTEIVALNLSELMDTNPKTAGWAPVLIYTPLQKYRFEY